MKYKTRINLIILVLLAMFFSFNIRKTNTPPKQCNFERVSIRTLSDTDAVKINLSAKRVSIADLVAIPKPQMPINNKTPRFGHEFNTYQVNCKITGWILEDNGDYHLIIQEFDDTTITIIGEILNTESPSLQKNPHYPEFTSVRTEFEKCKLPDGKVKKGAYKLIGVGFFDKIHTKQGSSKNGFELHPITYFSKFK